MYCGDETGSFIGEIGSHTCRFGYGGEDNPKFVTPSFVAGGKLAGSCLRSQGEDFKSILRRPEYENHCPLTDPRQFIRQGDLIENWEALEVAWHGGMDALRVKDTSKHTQGGTPYNSTSGDGKCVHPILAITPGFTQYPGHGPRYCQAVQRQEYIRYTELIIEQFQASAMFLAPSPMLAAFSLGRQTALVVDVGAGGCRVTPVVDGLILQQSQRRNGRGGDWLHHMLWNAMQEQKLHPKPRYLVRAKTPSTNNLFHAWAMQEFMYEIQTNHGQTLDIYHGQQGRVPFLDYPPAPAPAPAPATTFTPTTYSSSTSYQLPDGTAIDLTTPFGKDLSRVPELLFSEILPFSSEPNNLPLSGYATFSNAPLHQLIQESLLAVGDIDARKELAGQIGLSGGASSIPYLETRLSHALTQTLPGFVKPKVVAPRNSIERTFAPWIGASILTSLGSFQQLWLSQTEYEEYGATMSINRFL